MHMHYKKEETMEKTLVISGHPNLASGSLANKIIVDRLKSEENLEIRDLPALYPDFKIDIAAEQEALLKSDIIVFQYPFYWYSIPGIMKEWLDRVFAYGFAFGSSGDKLKGKRLILSTTVGGPEQSYQTEGYNTFTIDQLLNPLKQTASLSGLIMHPPVISHGMIYIPDVYNKKEDVEKLACEHAERLVVAIHDCRDNDT